MVSLVPDEVLLFVPSVVLSVDESVCAVLSLAVVPLELFVPAVVVSPICLPAEPPRFAPNVADEPTAVVSESVNVVDHVEKGANFEYSSLRAFFLSSCSFTGVARRTIVYSSSSLLGTIPSMSFSIL